MGSQYVRVSGPTNLSGGEEEEGFCAVGLLITKSPYFFIRFFFSCSFPLHLSEK